MYCMAMQCCFNTLYPDQMLIFDSDDFFFKTFIQLKLVKCEIVVDAASDFWLIATCKAKKKINIRNLHRSSPGSVLIF